MRCPSCNHSSAIEKYTCPACGQSYDHAQVVELEHLDYLLDWLEACQSDSQLEAGTVLVLRAQAARQHKALMRKALPPVAPAAAPQPVDEATTRPTPPPPALAVAASTPAASAPVQRAAVPPPPPYLDWGNAWKQAAEFVASGMLLRGLLYLGAFMVVVAALVLVVAFWNEFPAFLQVAFIAAMPLAFYAAGFVLRERLKIQQAGAVFTGIGALLVAVDFAAIYQLFGLRGQVDPALYWLIAAMLCAPVYAVTAWRVPVEFFGYVTLIALANIPLAFTAYMDAHPAWQIASTTFSATAMLPLTLWLRRYDELARAARRLPQAIVPLSVLLNLAGYLVSPRGLSAPLLATFALATMAYGLLALWFPKGLHARLGVASSLGAFLFAFVTLDLPLQWYATMGAVLAPLYLLAGHRLKRLPETFEPRAAYRQALTTAGLALLAIATLAAFGNLLAYDYWPAALAFALTTTGWVLSSVLFHNRAAAWVAVFNSVAVIAAVVFAVDAPIEWYGVVAAISALAYGSLGRWLTLFLPNEPLRHAYRPSAYVAGLGLLTVAVMFGWNAWRSGAEWAGFAALMLATMDCVLAALVFRRASFAWGACALFIFPFQIALSIAHIEWGMNLLFSVLLAAFGYTPLGLLMRHIKWTDESTRQAFAYSLAFVGYGFGLVVTGIALTASASVMAWMVVIVPWVFVAQLLVSGFYRFAAPLFAWTAAGIAPFAVWQSLHWLGVPQGYMAVVVALMGCAYMFGERALARLAGRQAYRWPLGAGSFLLAGFALLVSVGSVMADVVGVGRDAAYTLGIAALAQALVAAQTALAARLYRSRWPAYLTPWLATLAAMVAIGEYGAVWFGRALRWPEYALVCSAAGTAFVFLAAALDGLKTRYSHGLYFGAYALVGIAVLWSVAEQWVNIIVFGAALGLALCAHALTFFGRHHTLEDLLGFVLGKNESVLHRLARSTFLLFFVFAFPFWLLQLLAYNGVASGVRGLALTITAVVYALLEVILPRLGGERRRRLVLEWPFYLASAYLIVAGTMLALGTQMTATGSAVLNLVAAAVCGALAAIALRKRWLYPSLLAAHLALFAYLTTLPAGEPRYASLPFHALTWVVGLAGLLFTRSAPRPPEKASAAVHYLTAFSWAQPFLQFAALDVMLWQFVALGGADTTLTLAFGHVLLFALMATAWQDTATAFSAIGFALVGTGAVAWQLQWSSSQSVALFGAVSLALYWLGWAMDAGRSRWARMKIWVEPLTLTGYGVSVLAALSALGSSSIYQPSLAALTLGAAGLVYITAAYRQRSYGFGYLGVGLFLGAWVLLLLDWNVAQPQVYAVPAGLYLVGIGALERRRGRKSLGLLIESLGLAVMLVTTLIQSVRGAGAVLYVAVLLAEGALVIYWGAVRRVKIPFFIGMAAIVLDVVAQVAVLFMGGSTLTRWLIIGSAGLLMAFLAILVERQRARLIAFVEEMERWE